MCKYKETNQQTSNARCDHYNQNKKHSNAILINNTYDILGSDFGTIINSKIMAHILNIYIYMLKENLTVL